MLRRNRHIPAWEIVIPIVTLAVLGYTIYRNLVPYPSGPTYWLPIGAGIWIAVSIIILIMMPALSRRIGEELASEDGLTTAGSAAPATVSAADSASP